MTGTGRVEHRTRKASTQQAQTYIPMPRSGWTNAMFNELRSFAGLDRARILSTTRKNTSTAKIMIKPSILALTKRIKGVRLNTNRRQLLSSLRRRRLSQLFGFQQREMLLQNTVRFLLPQSRSYAIKVTISKLAEVFYDCNEYPSDEKT